MNNQEIIDNAPKREDFYFVDITGEYFDEFGNHLNSKGLWSDSDTSPVSPRSLADIKRITDLEKDKIELRKSELETYALVMANARRLIKANVRTSNGRLFSELFGTGFGTGRDSARSLGLNPDCNKTDYNQMRRHIDLEALKEPKP
jgi:hypothetical protein